MFKKLSLAMITLLLSMQVFAQNQFQWKEASGNGYTYKYVTSDPMQARFYTLKNGILTEVQD